ncbi:amidohydrolase family protein [Williamsia muralis]|uniref:amidohydrolase family protein n=1 Tax=Williamsia marianensis TaxID=85044 RepID=UPI0037F35A12
MQWTDTHVHVVDFLQRPADCAGLIRSLRDGGAERAVVFGLPVKKKWSTAEPLKPSYYLDDNAPCHYHSLTDVLVLDSLATFDEAPGFTVAPLICGFDPTDRLAVDHLEAVWARSDRWAGIGEVLLRHDDLTNLTRGETPVADHLAMDNVFGFCADKKVPISVHHDSSSAGRPSEQEYVEPFENAIRRHRTTRIVWCHAGVSRRVHPDGQIELVESLLSRHHNLTVELSWILLDSVVHGDGGVHPDWRTLICKFADRIVVGSDSVADPNTISDRATQIDQLLRALPGSVAQAVATDTAGELWFS